MSGSNVTGETVRRRSPLVAVALSGLFPGLGQFYNRQLLKGLLFLAGGLVTAFGPFNPLDIDIDLSDPTAGLRKVLLASLPFLVIASWSALDAYRTAQRTRRPGSRTGSDRPN